MGIFNNSGDNVSSDTASVQKIAQTRPTQSKNVSVIGPTLVFKGELSADEDLIIEGHIEGTIAHHNKHLTVGKQGRIKADVHASSVIVFGQIVGDIHCQGTVSLAKSAEVVGNIYCARIGMEDGARFKGKIDMGDAPKVSAVPKELAQVEPIRKEKPLTMVEGSAKPNGK
jgi:cytoskeletal protein CcmA (bactofilin family)